MPLLSGCVDDTNVDAWQVEEWPERGGRRFLEEMLLAGVGRQRRVSVAAREHTEAPARGAPADRRVELMPVFPRRLHVPHLERRPHCCDAINRQNTGASARQRGVPYVEQQRIVHPRTQPVADGFDHEFHRRQRCGGRPEYRRDAIHSAKQPLLPGGVVENKAVVVVSVLPAEHEPRCAGRGRAECRDDAHVGPAGIANDGGAP